MCFCGRRNLEASPLHQYLIDVDNDDEYRTVLFKSNQIDNNNICEPFYTGKGYDSGQQSAWCYTQ